MTAGQHEFMMIEAFTHSRAQIEAVGVPAGWQSFRAGYLAAEARLQPLLEAARAYRDAYKEYVEAHPAIAPWGLNEAERAFLEAARTFEASHVEGEAR